MHHSQLLIASIWETPKFGAGQEVSAEQVFLPDFPQGKGWHNSRCLHWPFKSSVSSPSAAGLRVKDAANSLERCAHLQQPQSTPLLIPAIQKTSWDTIPITWPSKIIGQKEIDERWEVFLLISEPCGHSVLFCDI